MLHRYFKISVALLMISLFFFAANGQHKFIHLKNNILVNGEDNPMKLHAVNLGGWLLWEGWIWGGGFTKESTIKERLQELLGQNAADNFMQQYYNTFITENDIAAIAKHGYNSIRVPFNYRIFEPQDQPYIDGFKKVDALISWCRKYGIYIILDMHAAPGGQNNLFISDPEKISLWDSEQDQQQTDSLWMKIAKRYADDTTIAGYDILNEPDVKNVKTLINFYDTLVKSIRSADQNHLLIIEGNKLAHDFTGFPEKFDDDQIYSYHYYPWFAEKHKSRYLDNIISTLHSNLPLWCGEWGEDTPDNIREINTLLTVEPRDCGTAFWTWKRVYKNNNRFPVYSIQPTSNWNKVMSWLTVKIVKPDNDQTKLGIGEFLQAIQLANCHDNGAL